MKKSTSFHLLQNTFELEDAQEVLHNLIMSKINFLDRQIFSIEERTGEPTDNQKKRIQDLKVTLAELKSFLDTFQESENQVKIEGLINIEVLN